MFEDCTLMAGMTEEGRSLQVVSFNEGRIRLHTEELSILLGRDDVKDSPVAVLSLIGVYRTGKSFLLNYLLRYLKANGQKGWLGNNTEPLRGFEWRQGVDTTTHGIHMWSQPFHVTSDDGRQVALLLMDTQGLFDNTLSSEDASMIFSLSTLLSSTQVYNLVAKLEEPHLKQLELFLEVSRMVLAVLRKPHSIQCFQRMVCLIRDWPDPEKYRYGANGGRHYLDSLFEAENRPLEIMKMLRNIQSVFQRFEFYLMPHPGIKAVVKDAKIESSDSIGEESMDAYCEPPFCGQLSDLRITFRRFLPKVAGFLLDSTNIGIKKIDGTGLNGRDLQNAFEIFPSILTSGTIPKMSLPREGLVADFNVSLAKEIVEKHRQFIAMKAEYLEPTNSSSRINNWIHEVADEEEKSLIQQFQNISVGNEEEKIKIIKEIKESFTATRKNLFKAFNSKLLETVLECHGLRAEQIYNLKNPERLTHNTEELENLITKEEKETKESFNKKSLGDDSDKEYFLCQIEAELTSWKKVIVDEREQRKVIQTILRSFVDIEDILETYLSKTDKWKDGIENKGDLMNSIADEMDRCHSKAETLKVAAGVGTLLAGTGAINGALSGSLSSGLPFFVIGSLLTATSYVALSGDSSSFFAEMKSWKKKSLELMLECQNIIQEKDQILGDLIEIIQQRSGSLCENKIFNVLLSAKSKGMLLKEFLPQVIWYVVDPSAKANINIRDLGLFVETKKYNWEDWENVLRNDEYMPQGGFLRAIAQMFTTSINKMVRLNMLMNDIPSAN